MEDVLAPKHNKNRWFCNHRSIMDQHYNTFGLPLLFGDNPTRVVACFDGFAMIWVGLAMIWRMLRFGDIFSA